MTQKMYAIGYKHEEEFYNFVYEQHSDILTLECTLPSKLLAEQYIENELSTNYFVLEVYLEFYEKGETSFSYSSPKEWN